MHPAHVCNTKLNVCVVNAASKVKCSQWQDTECSQNRCQSTTGKCAMTAVNDLKDCNADDNPCSVYDTCSEGACIAGANVCQCELDKGCDPFDDSDACTAQLYCEKPGNPPWFCVPNPAKKVVCPAGAGCNTQQCDPLSGTCKPAIEGDGKPCTDGSACTTDDVCALGKCVGSAKPCPKGDACSTFVCDPKSGDCAKSGKICDDKNVCTDDSCDPKQGGCVTIANTSKCDDNLACTLADACTQTVCKGEVKSCDDNEPCTTDSCDVQTGDCKHVPGTGGCNDGDDCTVKDACVTGKCKGEARNCDDANTCTADSCGAGGKCANEPKTSGVCDDGNACTAGETCAAGTCKGSAKDCDDSKARTVDACDPKTGCSNKAIADGGACGDNKACAGVGKCAAGKCEGQLPKLWSRQLNRTELWQELRDVAVTTKGEIVAVGYTAGKNGKSNEKPWWVAYDAAGQQVYEKTSEDNEVFSRVEPGSSGGAVVMGHRLVNGLGYGLVKGFDTNGKLSWTRLQSKSRQIWHDMTIVPGGYAVVGERRSGSRLYIRAGRYSSTGTEIWLQEASTDYNFALTAVAPGPKDGLIAMGTASARNRMIMWLDKDGKVTAQKTLRMTSSDVFSGMLSETNSAFRVANMGAADATKVLLFQGDGTLLREVPLEAGNKARIWDQLALPNERSVALGTNLVKGTSYLSLAEIEATGAVKRVSQTAVESALTELRFAHLPGGGFAMVGRLSNTPQFQQGRAVVRRIGPFGHSSCETAGKCDQKATSDCDDGKPCTVDSCVGDQGCVYAESTLSCDSDKPCDDVGVCGGGACVAGAKFRPYEVGTDAVELSAAVGVWDFTTFAVGTTKVAAKPFAGVLQAYNRAGKLTKAVVVQDASLDTRFLGAALHAERRVLAVGQRGTDALLSERYDTLGVYGEVLHTAVGEQLLFDAAYVPNVGGFVAVGADMPSQNKSRGLIVRRASNQKQISWTKTVGSGNDMTVLGAVAEQTDGTFILAGDENSTGARKVLLVNIDQAGTIAWTKTLAPTGKATAIYDVAVGPAGELGLVGGDDISGVAYLLLADPKATKLTSIPITVGSEKAGNLRSLLKTSGGWTALGEVGNPTSSRFIARVDDGGNVVFSRKLPSAASPSVAAALVEQPDGKLVVVGTDGDPAKQQYKGYVATISPWGDGSCADAGVCHKQPTASCDDDKPCTLDTCDAKAGCKNAAIAGCK